MAIDSNSIAVVTGAASGIGRAVAVAFAKEGVAGVVISDIDEAALSETAEMITELGVPVHSQICNVGDREQVQALHDASVERFGRVSHLINNAGVGLIGSFDQLSIEDFEWIMQINFWGVVYGCKIFLPTLLAQDSAHIVNVSSVFGLIAPEEQSAYCASKFAVRGFTDLVAFLGEDGLQGVAGVLLVVDHQDAVFHALLLARRFCAFICVGEIHALLSERPRPAACRCERGGP